MRKYVVGISGTHGTGKSFLVRHLEPHMAVDRTQLSRTAQKALGWDTLSRAEESEANVWALQNAILDAMIQRDEALNNLGEHLGKPVVVERTPADLYAYARMWLTRLSIDPEESRKFAEYQERLLEASHAYKTVLVIFAHPSIQFIAEPNRADEASREIVSNYIMDFLMCPDFPKGPLRTYIFQPDIDDRVRATLEALKLGDN